ncbi:MAG: hypothetical protein ACLPOA_24345 [Methylocella sp.]
MRKAVIASRSGGGPDAGQRKCSASYQRAGFAKNTLSRKPIRSPCAPNAEARKRLIDGRLLRTVAANLSASGLKRQNYDLIVISAPKRPERSSVLSMRYLPAAKLWWLARSSGGWREGVGSHTSFF